MASLRPCPGAFRESRLVGLLVPLFACAAAEPGDPVAAWLAQQARVKSWHAGFTQTRRLPTLAQPLTTTGRVWFRAPGEFRWELGDPVRSIAVRHGDRVRMISPRLKLEEVYPVDANAAGPWRDGLAMMEAGFPRSRAELESRFVIGAVRSSEGTHRLTLQPRAEGARRLLREVRLEFRLDPAVLLATEFEFADGTTMRNDYRNQQVNPPLAADLFNPATGPGHRVSHPLGK